MADDAFLMQMSLPELNNFVIERGIRLSEKRIIELSQRSSFKQNLERKCNLADKSARQLERRTVNGTVYPHPDLSDFYGELVLHKYLLLKRTYVLCAVLP